MYNEKIENICRRVSETLTGAKVTKTPYAYIVEIPDLYIKIHVELPTYKQFYKFSIILDDPVTKTFKVLAGNRLVPEMYDDKGYYIASYVQLELIMRYYGHIQFGYPEINWAWSDILKDKDAVSRIL